MGKYRKKATHHVDCIQRYYDHARGSGYLQAEYDYIELSELIMKAERSKNDKNDADFIRILKKKAEPLMEEMKKRMSELEKSEP